MEPGPPIRNLRQGWTTHQFSADILNFANVKRRCSFVFKSDSCPPWVVLFNTFHLAVSPRSSTGWMSGQRPGTRATKKMCRPWSWWPGRKPSDPSGHAWKLLSSRSHAELTFQPLLNNFTVYQLAWRSRQQDHRAQWYQQKFFKILKYI